MHFPSSTMTSIKASKMFKVLHLSVHKFHKDLPCSSLTKEFLTSTYVKRHKRISTLHSSFTKNNIFTVTVSKPVFLKAGYS